MSNLPPVEPPTLRRFWPNFVTAAVLAPLMWTLLIGLTLPDDAVGFYIVCIVGTPVLFALVILPAWWLATDAGNSIAVRIAAPVIAVPGAAAFLWSAGSTLWLLSIVLTEGI